MRLDPANFLRRDRRQPSRSRRGLVFGQDPGRPCHKSLCGKVVFWVSEKLGHGRQAIAHTLALPRPFGPYQNVSRETFLSDSSPKPYKAENSGFSVNLVRSIDFLV